MLINRILKDALTSVFDYLPVVTLTGQNSSYLYSAQQ